MTIPYGVILDTTRVKIYGVNEQAARANAEHARLLKGGDEHETKELQLEFAKATYVEAINILNKNIEYEEGEKVEEVAETEEQAIGSNTLSLKTDGTTNQGDTYVAIDDNRDFTEDIQRIKAYSTGTIRNEYSEQKLIDIALSQNIEVNKKMHKNDIIQAIKDGVE